jgi:hypothetical protein
MAGDQWNQGRLLELSGKYWETCTLHAAVKLDLFTNLGTDALEGTEIAGRLDGDRRGVSTLLNALVAMGLLTRTDGKYSNTPAAMAYLSKGSEQYVGFMIMHHHHLVESWGHLDRAVLSGKPVRGRASFGKEELLQGFLMGMHTLARQLAPKVSEALDLSGRSHLLDLGGGPGTYAVNFCLKNPGLRATVFDLPTSRPFAEGSIRKAGLEGRVDFLAGSYLEDTIPRDYDVAWLSQILHGEGPEACRLIIERAVSALQPGGLIVVHEFLLQDTLDGPLFPALFSLNMLLGTSAGQAYSEGQVRDMLAGAGVRDIRRLPFQGPNDSGLIAGSL